MKQLISIGAVLVVGAIIFLYVPRAIPAPQTAATMSSVAAVPVPVAKPVIVSSSSMPVAATVANATLSVGTTTYPINVSTGETVMEAMRSLAAENNAFTFTGQDYPSLGYFVTSIDGQENADGRYWILYVNDVSAPAGASSVVLHEGDRVSWRYEKGY